MNRSTFKLMLAAACVLVPTWPVAAQTFYTAKLLTPPSGSTCTSWQALLGENGDVVAPCDFGKSDPLGDFFLAFSSNTLDYLRYGDTMHKLQAWRAKGTTQTLTGGTSRKADARLSGIFPNGDVLGWSRASDTGPEVMTVWKGTTRSTWSPPSGLPATGWQVAVVSPGGHALLLRNASGTEDLYVTVVDGVAKALPTLPAACAVTGDVAQYDMRIGDQGQVAAIHNEAVVHPELAFRTAYEATACLWQGSGWRVSPDLPEATEAGMNVNHYRILGVTGSGQVWIRGGSEQDHVLSWSGGATVKSEDPMIKNVGVNDDVLGGSTSYGYPVNARATLWRQGVAVDLNSRTTALPSGLVLKTAIGSNARGQILTLAGPAASPFPAEGKLVLLTPR